MLALPEGNERDRRFNWKLLLAGWLGEIGAENYIPAVRLFKSPIDCPSARPAACCRSELDPAVDRILDMDLGIFRGQKMDFPVLKVDRDLIKLAQHIHAHQ